MPLRVNVNKNQENRINKYKKFNEAKKNIIKFNRIN